MKIPGPVAISAAWSGLPVSLRDHIGFIAFDMVFQGFLSGQAYAPEDYVLPSDEDRGEAFDRECRGLSELYRTIEDAVPDLFGPKGEHPAWVPVNAEGPAGAVAAEANTRNAAHQVRIQEQTDAVR